MAESSQNRVHFFFDFTPLKRLTLTGLGFMFGTTVALAIGLQFVWALGMIVTPVAEFRFDGHRDGLAFTILPRVQPTWDHLLLWHGYTESGFRPGFDPESHGRVLPGVYCETNELGHSIGLSHAWLISLAASLYLLSRCWIRRAARLQNQPS